MTETEDGSFPLDRIDYVLPPGRIAQRPVEPRDSARLLVIRRADGSLEDRRFLDLPDQLRAGDLLVLNDTRVLRARLRARRETGGTVEFLLLSQVQESIWRALARPLKRLREDEHLRLLGADGADTGVTVTVSGRDGQLALIAISDDSAIERYGEMPLPPYIRERLDDAERYQTVYADALGSAAAPTAGLHFTERLFDQLHERGVSTVRVTLHVGLDTFQPVTETNVLEHRIHAEWFRVGAEARREIARVKREGRRVIAVGTTSVRVLESLARHAHVGENEDVEGWTRLYITPGFRFQLVDAMITNFHLPRSTLLLLVYAFAGEGLTRAAYAHAIEHGYRFYSFGDASLIV